MNRTPDNADPLDELATSLQQLQPAANGADPAELFYRAGIAAGRAQGSGTARWRQAIQVATAAIIACAIVAPASYQLGQQSRRQVFAETEAARNNGERSETSLKSAGDAPPSASPAREVPFVAPALAGSQTQQSAETPTNEQQYAAQSETDSQPKRTSNPRLARSPPPDFWRRWLTLEAMFSGEFGQPLTVERPRGNVLTASHSPEMLERWLEDRKRLVSDHPKPIHQRDQPRPKTTTLSVGDAKRWVEISQTSIGAKNQ